MSKEPIWAGRSAWNDRHVGIVEAAGSNPVPSTFRGPGYSGKILNVLWELKKQGYADVTIKGHCKRLRMLAKHVGLDNPEAIKSHIANQNNWSNASTSIHIMSENMVCLGRSQSTRDQEDCQMSQPQSK